MSETSLTATRKRVAGTAEEQHASRWSLARILEPVDPTRFFEDYWAARPLYIARQCPEFYGNLITLSEVERYLAMEEIFARQSITTPTEGYGIPDPPPSSLPDVYGRLIGGRSLRIRKLECFVDPGSPVLELLRDMERTLQHPRDSLSCYIAPPETAGLGPHHDETEIFTLQISGAKRWRLYHRVDSDQPAIHSRDSLGLPEQDLTLHPGDLLYLPRGYVHHVTSDKPSFSLTIVFDPVKWSALLHLLTEKLASAPLFMEAMPAGSLLAEKPSPALVEQFEARLEAIRQALGELTAPALLDHVAPTVLGRMLVPPARHFESVFEADALTLASVVEKRPEIDARLTRRAGRVSLTLTGGATLQAAGAAEPALRDVLARSGPFRIEQMHNSLTAEARIVLARQLVRCGLLRVLLHE